MFHNGSREGPELGHLIRVDSRHGHGQQFLSGIAQYGASLGIYIEDLIVRWINDEDRIVRVIKDLAEPLLALPQRLLRPLARCEHVLGIATQRHEQ